MQNTALIRTTDNEPQGICQHRVTEVGSQISGMMSSLASMAESSVQGKKRMPRWYKEGRKRCLWWEHGQPVVRQGKSKSPHHIPASSYHHLLATLRRLWKFL